MKIEFSNSQIESQFLNWWQANLLTDNPLKCRVQFVNNQCLMSFSMDFHCVWVINNWAFVFVLMSLSLLLSSFLFCLCVDVVLSFIISRWCLWVVVVEIFLFQFSDDDTQSRCIISCCWCSSSLFCVSRVSCVVLVVFVLLFISKSKSNSFPNWFLFTFTFRLTVSGSKGISNWNVWHQQNQKRRQKSF